jgi:tRNA pseudouridine(55) synthase
MSPYHTQNSDNSQDKNGVFPIYKKAGETLAALIVRFRSEQSLGNDIPVTYAGRLDPMADGLVLLLTGEKCKEKDDFLGLDKTYTFEVLFGVATDTFDMLGLITDSKESLPTEKQIEAVLGEVKNKTLFSYPPFSSKPVDGQPLFMHAKAGTLPNVLPEIKGEIHSIVLRNTAVRSMREVVESSVEVIKKVEGDFRQGAIIEGWQKFLKDNESTKCLVATFETQVSSGVYVRSIATIIGEALDIPALAYSITRKNVGKYKL